MITNKLTELSTISIWGGSRAVITELKNHTFFVYSVELNEEKSEWVKKEKVLEFITSLPTNEDTLTELRRLYFATLK